MTLAPPLLSSDAARSPRARLLDALRLNGPLARVELVAVTDLSPATVTAATAQLLDEGLLETVEEQEAEAAEGGVARRGRPRVRLQLAADAALVVGVKISLHCVAVSVANLAGDVLAAETVAVSALRRPPGEIADRVAGAVRGALARLGLGVADIAGVGLGLPGFIDGDAGLCHWSPVFDRPGVAFAALMAERLERPVFLDNDANLVAFAEQWFGLGKGVANFLVVTIEHGVGMGAVIDGRLYRGRGGLGGEFGHTKVQRSGALCRCGQRGCIEAYLADYAILREASVFFDVAPGADPAARQAGLDDLIARGLAGDARIAAIYARAGEILGLGLANLVNIFSPELLVLSGDGARAAPLFEATMRAALRENALSISTDDVQIETRLEIRQSDDALWARGAAAMVLGRLLYREASRRLGPGAGAGAGFGEAH